MYLEVVALFLSALIRASLYLSVITSFWGALPASWELVMKTQLAGEGELRWPAPPFYWIICATLSQGSQLLYQNLYWGSKTTGCGFACACKTARKTARKTAHVNRTILIELF